MSILDTRPRVSHKAPGYTKLVYLTRSGGYVMVKHPRCMPFVMTEKEWNKLDIYEVLRSAGGSLG